MGNLIENIRLAAIGRPYEVNSVDNTMYGSRVSIDYERIRQAREIQKARSTMDFDFSHNIRTLKHLLTILEEGGYSYLTVKSVQDTIKYLEEKEKESK